VQRVEEVGKSEGLWRWYIARNGADRATKGGDTQPERVQTFDWCLVTRELEKPAKETKQMTAVLGTTAGAVSNEAMNWHDIEWEEVHRNVRRLQARSATRSSETAVIDNGGWRARVR
jgi:hypothetical protein